MIQNAKRLVGAEMKREGALKIVLALVGLIFSLLAYPAIIFVRQDPSMSMMFSIYVTLGIFLLIAIRNPFASRSLIAFTAWSSLFMPSLWALRPCEIWFHVANWPVWRHSSLSE